MKYILADEKKAQAAGFSPSLHVTVKGRMVLNEREVEQNGALEGMLARRARAIGGTIYESAVATKKAINNINKPVNQ